MTVQSHAYGTEAGTRQPRRLRQLRPGLRVGQVVVEGGAASCGFSHQEHLTRVIRSHLGTTPAVLRREG